MCRVGWGGVELGAGGEVGWVGVSNNFTLWTDQIAVSFCVRLFLLVPSSIFALFLSPSPSLELQ